MVGLAPKAGSDALNDLGRHDAGQLGPAMALLTEKQRLYVHALFEAPKSYGSGVFAIKMAGYGTASSSRQSLAQLAYQLNSDPKIQAAISEVSQQHLTVLGPAAVRALRRVLDNPKHRDHGRALGIVMDRVAPQNSTHTVKVEGEVKITAAEATRVMDRIEQLCAKFGVALPTPKVIDHEVAA
jgi:phage terminase small subunit